MTTNDSLTLAGAETRGQLFRWLSTLFVRELDQKTLDLYHRGAGKDFLKQMAAIPALESDVTALQKVLVREDNMALDALALASEYGYLFLGGGGPQSVSPYESVYTSKNGSMFQEAEQQTREILGMQGLGISKEIREPADHIAIQLELFAHLDEMADSVASTDAESASVLKIQAKTFLENHLLNWVPGFSANCLAQDPDGFYGALARLTVTILNESNLYFNQDN
ncbi:MAG: molecular chaperone TorD [Deltaproteobacteria bacterium]|uniref:molecular chaperone TorD n=1 Tax=Desulfobacula sp. TaxID=2593537 RepID=UPI0019BC3326|nr:molecular chaperone TorD [Candidatus Desulfobacula maris]MBL6995746.1 molecular chaperone TorD [Desulfobacula sp.]